MGKGTHMSGDEPSRTAIRLSYPNRAKASLATDAMWLSASTVIIWKKIVVNTNECEDCDISKR
jgi:hypothetical protein